MVSKKTKCECCPSSAFVISDRQFIGYQLLVLYQEIDILSSIEYIKTRKLYICMPLLQYFNRLRADTCSLVGLSIFARVPVHPQKDTSTWCIELVKTP